MVLFTGIFLYPNSSRNKTNIELKYTYKKNKTFNELFIKIKEISLETKEGFYLSDEPRISCVNDKDEYIILDNTNVRQILVFNHNGKAIGKIGNEGKGPGEYLYPESIDYYNKSYYVYDSDLKRLTIYNYDYSYKSSKNLLLPFQKLQITGLNQIYFYRTNMAVYPQSNHVIFEADTNGQILNSFHNQSDFYSLVAVSKGGGILIHEDHLFVMVPYEYKISKYSLKGNLLREIIRKSDRFVPPPKIDNMDEILDDIKKHFAYHRRWGPILQLLKIGNYLGVIFKQPRNQGKNKYLELFDFDLQLVYANIILPNYIYQIYSKENKIYLLQEIGVSTLENVPNPKVVEYELKSQYK
jgi:hypothetical protein